MKRIILTFFIALSSTVYAAPITFNTALPVAKGAFINREQLIVRRFDEDNTSANRDLEVNGLVSVLGYGVTPKLALFAAMPYFNKTLDITPSGQRFSRSSEGFGDIKLFGRYTFLQHDGRSKTFRVAGFAGIKAPTGGDNQRDSLGLLPIPLQSGTGAWDTFGGVVMTYQRLNYQIDAQLSANKKGRAKDFRGGDEVRADLSLQYRLSALNEDTRRFVYGVLEVNWVNQDNNQISGISDANSGGTTLYLTPGIQYVTTEYILEAAVQLPVVQNLHGSALETDYIFTTGFRINF